MSPYRNAILLIGLLILSPPSHATNAEIVNRFIAALESCDRGLSMPLPKSQGSLDILLFLFNKYQTDRNDALEKVPNLPQFSSIYSGQHFKSVSFAEAYQRCETQFAEKVKQAEIAVRQRLDARQRRFAAQQPQLEKLLLQIQQAELHAANAVEQGCAHTQVTAENAAALYPKYLEEKQKAEQLYADIRLQPLPLKSDTKTDKTKIKSVNEWFQTCDALFARWLPASPKETKETIIINTLPYLTDFLPVHSLIFPLALIPTPQWRETAPIVEKNQLVSLAVTSPEPPMQFTAPVEPVQPPQPVVMQSPEPETVTEIEPTLDEKYQEVLAQAQGDRLRILQQEKRLPDTLERNELNYHKSPRWLYQKITAAGKEKCVIYHFANQKLVRTRESNGQCP